MKRKRNGIDEGLSGSELELPHLSHPSSLHYAGRAPFFSRKREKALYFYFGDSAFNSTQGTVTSSVTVPHLGSEL
jgi:hypothetical protein